MAVLLRAGLLVLFASTASAGGLNLRWTECEGDGGVQNMVFACDSNTGVRSLACSFTLDSDMFAVLSNELVIDIATAGATLAPWWELRGPMSCRLLGTTPSLTIGHQDGLSCP